MSARKEKRRRGDDLEIPDFNSELARMIEEPGSLEISSASDCPRDPAMQDFFDALANVDNDGDAVEILQKVTQALTLSSRGKTRP